MIISSLVSMSECGIYFSFEKLKRNEFLRLFSKWKIATKKSVLLRILNNLWIGFILQKSLQNIWKSSRINEFYLDLSLSKKEFVEIENITLKNFFIDARLEER